MGDLSTRCIIIDDEPLAIELVESHISQIENLELIGTFKNPTKAFVFLKKHPVDLIFLDIQMPGMSGIDFLKSMVNIPPVILTTAYREYALDAFDLEVIDYLLKPITFERFFKAIDKYLRNQNNHVHPTEETQEYLYVKADRKYRKIKFSKILYIESKKDYLKIQTKESSVIIKEKISDFIKSLPENLFVRVHRSYIVNTSNVTAFTYSDVEIDELEIPIGGTYKNLVVERLKTNK